MTSDERFERLAMSMDMIGTMQEALRQSIEMLISMHRENGCRFEEQGTRLEQQIEERRKESDEHRRFMLGVIESIAQTNTRLEQTTMRLEQTTMRLEQTAREIQQTNAQPREEQARIREDQARMREERKRDRSDFGDIVRRLSLIAEAHQIELDAHESRLEDSAR